MTRVRTNFFYGTLSGTLATTATTLTCAELASFPVVASPDVAYLVLNPAGAAPEVVKVTAHTSSATTATIVRAQDGSSDPGTTYAIGTVVIQPPIGTDFSSLVQPDLGGKETIQSHGNTGSTETIDLANGNLHTAAQDQACTYTLSGFTNGYMCSMTLILTSVTGSATWPAAVKWKSGAAPTLSGVTTLTFWSVDGGTTIYGAMVGSGFA